MCVVVPRGGGFGVCVRRKCVCGCRYVCGSERFFYVCVCVCMYQVSLCVCVCVCVHAPERFVYNVGVCVREVCGCVCKCTREICVSVSAYLRLSRLLLNSLIMSDRKILRTSMVSGEGGEFFSRAAITFKISVKTHTHTA